MNVFISKPDVALQATFMQMLDDYTGHDPEHGRQYATARPDFSAYVQGLHEDELGFVSIVPCSHRWVVNAQGSIVGVVRVRHHIHTEFLANELGHIGNDVPSSQRGRGFGVITLKAGLEHVRALGRERVLLYADTDISLLGVPLSVAEVSWRQNVICNITIVLSAAAGSPCCKCNRAIRPLSKDNVINGK
jgi:predicted acetyltransferase